MAGANLTLILSGGHSRFDWQYQLSNKLVNANDEIKVLKFGANFTLILSGELRHFDLMNVSMVANLGDVDSEIRACGSGLEFTASLKKINKFCRRHTLGRTSIKPLLCSETLDNSINQTLLCSITVALHHMENLVSVCHNVKRSISCLSNLNLQ